MAAKVEAVERTRQGIAAAEAGQIEDARQLLGEALAIDPEYQPAWLWFAAVTEDPGEQRFCLEKAREVDPEHRGSPMLGKLKDSEPVAPAELTGLVDPEPPEFISGFADQARAQRRRRLLIRTTAVVAILALLAGTVALIANARVKYTYLAIVVEDSSSGQLGGQESVAAAESAVADWNSAIASSNEQLRLVTFTDGGDPAKAKAVAEQIVADGRFAGVIGHSSSATSLAAAPVYSAAGIPAITAMATADELTANNPWYYRTVFDNSQQAKGIAIYANGVEHQDKAIVVSTDSAYGKSLRNGFVDSFSKIGTIQADIVVPADPAQQEAALSAAAKRIAAIPDRGFIALFAGNESSATLATDLQALGVQATFIASDALATDTFFTGLSKASKATVNKSLAATPLTEGTLSGAAVTFYDEFSKQVGHKPGWSAGLTFDAVNAFTQALVRTEGPWGTDDLTQTRESIRAGLDSARSPETALPVLTGGLYFEPNNSAARPVAFEDGRISPSTGTVTVNSAAFQLSPYNPTVGVTLPQELAAGTAVTILGETYAIQRVIKTGFNINQVDSLSAGSQTFSADFFIWFKYRGAEAGPTDVVFANSVDPSLTLGDVQRSSLVDGEYYKLYRVKGTFRAQMEFSAFPFDSQRLPIVVQNANLPAGKVTYIPDPDNLDQTQEQRLQSGVDAAATIDQIPNWQADAVQFFPTSVGNTGALGDPSVAGSQGITYSQMVATNLISRDVSSFLIKNLLPLILLTIVVYVSLWYPFKDATARISFGVTGILTGAVMLNSVTSSLPSVDYTVAIEWAYYGFILLSGLCILGTLIGRNYTESRQLAKARTLEVVLRVGYPLFIVGVVVAYMINF